MERRDGDGEVCFGGEMAEGLRAFEGSVALVTGAGSGIGKALSDALALRGSHVVLADIDRGDAAAAAGQIRERGGQASARQLDVCSFADFKAVVDETAEELGRIDYIFNNAGIGVVGEAADYTIDAWDRILGGEPARRDPRGAVRVS
jgi:NAD(P)-dependent dehydrogenase (short-subunit alcohol dehydrogenase family)